MQRLAAWLTMSSLTLAICAVPNISFAQGTRHQPKRNPPTLRETIFQLKEDLSRYYNQAETPVLSGNKRVVREFTPIEFSDCNLSWRITEESRENPQPEKLLIEYKVNLADFDFQLVENGGSYSDLHVREVRLVTTGRKNLASFTFPGTPDNPFLPIKTSMVTFKFRISDEAFAERIARGFRRAIIICGGKTSKKLY
jgi:hypothetical protein